MLKPPPDPTGHAGPELSWLVLGDSHELTALVRRQMRLAYRVLETWQPGDEPAHAVWASGVMEAQHADRLSRFWHLGHHGALHGPWALHVLGGGRLFEHDQRRAIVTDRQDDIIVAVTWGQVGALLDEADPDLRFACDEALVVHDLLTGNRRGEIWQAAQRVSCWRLFQIAAVVWESIRPATLNPDCGTDESGADAAGVRS